LQENFLIHVPQNIVAEIISSWSYCCTQCNRLIVVLSSVCSSACLWRSLLWRNNTCYSKIVCTSE